jgi:soluble lytic murein transglycosylase
MQLMPETAEEVAKQLKMDGYDLTDPADNLRIGSRYLGRLSRKLASLSKALMAYNAGPTRMRRYDREYNRPPAELLLESLPLDETRHYVRKVLVSTILYSTLYGKIDPGTIIHIFYPTLHAEK